ncbi:IclR family transcriptional regulator domain-containing protein [Phyllobacterium sp. 22229]|uniref:IclR family transcriptional regulator C-terminal domain-containing protein n=1 Tax=Agrobacterium radiobacter TaxID=362 RepID=A0ABD5LPS4_AGRRD
MIVNHQPERSISCQKDAYKDVRALSRGLSIIEALGTLGWVKLGALSAYTGIDRTTVYRLVNTLAETGYVSRREGDGAVNLSWKLLQITGNLRGDDLTGQIVMRHLAQLTEAIKWPSDFATLSGGGVHIAVSTHNMSPMSMHRGMIGRKRPLLRSALGKAILSAMSPDELRQTLDITQRLDTQDAQDARSTFLLERMTREVRELGYASAVGTTEAKFSAIALPVCPGGSVIGAVNIVFFRSALTPAEAAERYLGRFRECARAIEAEITEAISNVVT